MCALRNLAAASKAAFGTKKYKMEKAILLIFLLIIFRVREIVGPRNNRQLKFPLHSIEIRQAYFSEQPSRRGCPTRTRSSAPSLTSTTRSGASTSKEAEAGTTVDAHIGIPEMASFRSWCNPRKVQKWRERIGRRHFKGPKKLQGWRRTKYHTRNI